MFETTGLVAVGTWHVESALQVASDVNQHSAGEAIRGLMVLACYVLWNVAYVLMMIKGRREKTYGMPPLGAAANLAICLIALYGPFSGESHLFYYKKNYMTMAFWAISAVLQGGVYLQYVLYGKRDAPLIPELGEYFYVVAIGTLVTLLVTFWTFIIYYQDYYVNEICPVAVLIAAVTFFRTLRERPDLRGLSVAVAWMLAIGDLLLYSAVVFGDMTDPYPEASFGYGYIYWVYALTIVLNFAYVYAIVQRRRELAAKQLQPLSA